MSRSKSKFESQVHLGLLVIIFTLLFVNFMSNVVLYRARLTEIGEANNGIRNAILTVTQTLQENFPDSLTDRQVTRLNERLGLASIDVVASVPEQRDQESVRRWFAKAAPSFNPVELPELARKLITSEFRHLSRGKDRFYSYVSPISVGGQKELLILTVDLPQLAYLEDALQIIRMIALGSFVVVLLVYVLLSRSIFRPIRKITEQAREAGRRFDDSENEAEAVAEDYRRVIEQLKRNEAELLQLNEEVKDRAASLEQFNQYLLESIDSGMITLDSNGIVLSQNDAAGKLLSSSPDSAVGLSYGELLAQCPSLLHLVEATLASGEVPGYREIEWTDKDEQQRSFGTTLSFIRDRHGQQVGLAILLSDLSELYNLRRDLARKKQLAALGEMSAGLAHQMRNSLGAIDGFGTLVKRRIDDDSAKTSIESLLQESREAEKLISRFLNFARPLTLETTRFDLGQLVGEIVASFRVRPDCRATEFDFRCPDRMACEGDPILLKQAISNIIDNAVEATEGTTGLVTVTISEDSDSIVVRIEDTGSGILDEDKEKLFTPFFSSRPSGTGLGLPLAGKMVDLHGGRIVVDSTVGEGSCFSIYLPLAGRCKKPKENISRHLSS